MNSKNPISPNFEKSEQDKKNAKIKVRYFDYISFFLFLLYNELSSKVGIKFDKNRHEKLDTHTDKKLLPCN